MDTLSVLSFAGNNNRSVILLTDPQDNSLNSLNSLDPESEDFDLEKWAEEQWDQWPDIETDLQFGLNFETYEFDYCIAYFSYWKWKIDMRLTCFPENGRYNYYAPQLTIDIGQPRGPEQ